VQLERTPLISAWKTVVTPDTADALRALERAAAKLGGVRLTLKGVPRTTAQGEGPGPTGYPPALSMRMTGREVYLRVHITGTTLTETQLREAEVATLWGLAVPLGFTPWLRYPVPGAGDEVFHFLGPWRTLYDFLCGQGRGELAWPSLCAAAQVDVGNWEGPKRVERFVQAQLHRLGHHCGPVNGEIDENTAKALRALGLHGQTFEEMAQALLTLEAAPTTPQERRQGHVHLPGSDVSVVSYGQVAAIQTRQGIALTVDGPGKVIINIGQED